MTQTREDKIKQFVPRDYWEVHAEFIAAAGLFLRAYLRLAERARPRDGRRAPSSSGGGRGTDCGSASRCSG